MSQRRIVGAIVKVPLNDGYHTYAWTLHEASFAFFDCRTNEEIKDLGQIVSRPILFIIAVYKSAITKEKWKNIGKVPLDDRFSKLPLKFMQDSHDHTRFSIYDNGAIRPASREECIGLERAAVWEAEHVEERIEDYYAGRPNKWVESLKIK